MRRDDGGLYGTSRLLPSGAKIGRRIGGIGRRRGTPSSLPVGGFAAMPEPKDPFNDDESPLAGHPLYEDMRRAVLIFTALASAGSLENVRTMLSATGSDDLHALALEHVGVEVRRAMREAAELSALHRERMGRMGSGT